jgi:hypothetical protein
VQTAFGRSRRVARTLATTVAIAMLLGLALSPATARAGEFDIAVDSVDALAGLTAVVDGAGGPVNLRSEPGLGADVVARVADGTVVVLRVDALDTVRLDGNRWWPVTADGIAGWMAGAFLAASNGASADVAAGVSTDSAPFDDSEAAFANGAYVKVATDDGAGLRIRAGASASDEIVRIAPQGTWLQVLDGPVGDGWYYISDGDVIGYVWGGWLEIASGPATDASNVAEFWAGDWVQVSTDDGAGLNIREDASRNAARIDALPQGALAQIVDGPFIDADGQPWYLVEADGLQGYAIGVWFEAASAPALAVPDPGVATGSLRYPLDSFTITQNFGCSYLGFYTYDPDWGCPVHDGLDLAAKSYSAILAADGGTVTAAGWCSCGLGYFVTIDHGNGIETIYGHMAEQPWVAVGDLVARGDTIGPVGSTGVSTGPHIHFMVLVDGAAVDPLDYLVR